MPFLAGRDMPIKPNLTPLPYHPSVGTEVRFERLNGKRGPVVDVTCPVCHTVRPIRTSVLRRWMETTYVFSGACQRCARKNMRTHLRKGRAAAKSWRKRLNHSGYVVLGSPHVSDADLPLFDKMRNAAHVVMEHRWVMAKFIGRPLHKYELVDHLNGDRTDNRIENLRIYVRGKNEPGSAGHGTYYHEWQMALARIALLEKELGIYKPNFSARGIALRS